MTVYTPQVWSDNDITKPLSAARMNHIEAGLLDAAGLVTPTAWTAPALLNSWVNSGGALQVAQYRKEGDRIHLRGSIKTGALTTVAFNLPVGFRLPATQLFDAVMTTTGTVGAIYVNANGDVVPYYGGNTEVHLDGINFSVTP